MSRLARSGLSTSFFHVMCQCINYVHLNPVKAKIVTDCSEYQFSSYNDFIDIDVEICNFLKIKH